MMAKIWYKKIVKAGDSVIPPTNPSHYGYVFQGWTPTTYTNVQENLRILSEYSRMTFTVTFIVEGQVISIQSVPYKGSCIPPGVEPRAGYNFGWDRSFSNITEDTVITGMYRSTEGWYDVRFYDIDEQFISGSLQRIKYGQPATAPSVPTSIMREGYKYVFQGWDKPFDYIETDLDIYSKYFPIQEKMTIELTSGAAYDFEISSVGTAVNLTQSTSAKANVNLLSTYSNAMGKKAIVKSVVDKSYSITKIDPYGFYGTYAGSKLTSVSFPKVTDVGNYAFMNDKVLADIQLPELTSIGMQSFKGVLSAVTVATPHVVNFDKQAFYGCTNLKKVDIVESQTIQNEAFRGCKNLNIQVKSDTLARIGDAAFYGCVNLTGDIMLPSAISIGKNCFASGTNRNVTSISIPNVTEIGAAAFGMFGQTVTAMTLNNVLKNDANVKNLWGIGTWKATSPDTATNKAKRQITITWVD